METLTVKDILSRSAQWLAGRGIENARLDAEVLLAHILGLSRLQLYLGWDRPVEEAEKERLRGFLQRRAAHEPVAYIVGRREFHSFDLEVGPAVLVPRPETELLVERALEILRGPSPLSLLSRLKMEREIPEVSEVPEEEESAGPGGGEEADKTAEHKQAEASDGMEGCRETEETGGGPDAEAASPEPAPDLPAPPSAPAWRIADVGTGSGAIAIALARELPSARIWATDISEAALAVARRNALSNQVAPAIDFLAGSLLDPVDAAAEAFHLVVSNPPYIAETERAGLPPDVVRFEPPEALFAGADGLDLIRLLIPQAAARLLPGGWLLIEIGSGQGGAVRALAAADGRYDEAAIHRDFQGLDRVAAMQRCGAPPSASSRDKEPPCA